LYSETSAVGKGLLLAKGLWEYVDGSTVTADGASNQVRAEFRKMPQKAFSAIVLAINSNQLYLHGCQLLIRDLTTSTDISWVVGNIVQVKPSRVTAQDFTAQIVQLRADFAAISA